MPSDQGGETKHDRCARKVKEKNPSVTNPHAVCVAAGVEPEKWKKSLDDKDEFVKTLSDIGCRESALRLKNWGEMDDIAKAVSEEWEALDKAYIGFTELKSRLASKKGVHDPAGLAAAIGRKKYGKDKFQHAAAKSKKIKKGEDIDRVIKDEEGQASSPDIQAKRDKIWREHK